MMNIVTLSLFHCTLSFLGRMILSQRQLYSQALRQYHLLCIHLSSASNLLSVTGLLVLIWAIEYITENNTRTAIPIRGAPTWPKELWSFHRVENNTLPSSWHTKQFTTEQLGMRNEIIQNLSTVRRKSVILGGVITPVSITSLRQSNPCWTTILWKDRFCLIVGRMLVVTTWSLYQSDSSMNSTFPM